MGQPIQVTPYRAGNVVIFDTDRSITGQDGSGYAVAADAAADDRFPGRLALRLFEADAAIDHVFIASNQVVIRRGAEWDDGAVADASRVIGDFFLFYPEPVAS